jgi:hypothetical protein
MLPIDVLGFCWPTDTHAEVGSKESSLDLFRIIGCSEEILLRGCDGGLRGSFDEGLLCGVSANECGHLGRYDEANQGMEAMAG